jgi:hypothetical protein
LMTVQQEDTWLPVATPVRARRTAFQADRFSETNSIMIVIIVC